MPQNSTCRATRQLPEGSADVGLRTHTLVDAIQPPGPQGALPFMNGQTSVHGAGQAGRAPLHPCEWVCGVREVRDFPGCWGASGNSPHAPATLTLMPVDQSMCAVVSVSLFL